MSSAENFTQSAKRSEPTNYTPINLRHNDEKGKRFLRQ